MGVVSQKSWSFRIELVASAMGVIATECTLGSSQRYAKPELRSEVGK